MDYKEEQDGEVETLRAIYSEEEFSVISEDPWNFEVTVKSDVDDTELQCIINFTLPMTYPEVVPIISLSNQGQLTDTQQTVIVDALNEEAQANLEMPMVFSIVSIAQDVLQDFLRVMEEEKVKRENEAEQEKLKADEAKYKGTPVTMETFSAWRQQFFIEMDKQNGKLKETGNQSKGLTGRQMFERDITLAISDARFLTELDETEDRLKDVEIDESLFQELGDLDEDLENI